MGLSFHLGVIQGRKKKRIRRRQSRELPNPNPIPVDLVIDEILTRLPTKSLMRFKSVSKLWSSIITSKYFTNRFLSVPSPRLYLSLQDCTDHNKSVTLSLAPASSSSSFEVNHDLTITNMEGCILQDLPGFMWCTSPEKPSIFNPATRQVITLPIVKLKLNFIAPPGHGSIFKIFSYYVGHDPFHNQYKVVCTIGICLPNLQQIRSEHWVFVLGGGVWRIVTPPPSPDFLPHMSDKRGSLCIDGVIYYLAWIDMYSFAIVSFKVSSEEFDMIQVPLEELYGRAKNVSLIEYGGKVTMFDQTKLRVGVVDLWVLGDVGNKNWLRKTLVLQHCHRCLVNNFTSFKVNGTSQNGKVLLVPVITLPWPFYILCYDIQKNDLRKIEIKGIPDRWFRKSISSVLIDAMLMEQSESLMSLDTDSNSLVL